jgi:hypothetical protein
MARLAAISNGGQISQEDNCACSGLFSCAGNVRGKPEGMVRAPSEKADADYPDTTAPIDTNPATLLHLVKNVVFSSGALQRSVYLVH